MAEQMRTPPLETAEEAKRSRDLVGEISALNEGHRQLENAPWAPTRSGDRLVVAFEAVGDNPGFTETYEVISSGLEHWPEQTELRLVGHTAPHDQVGFYAGSPALSGGDAIETVWMEAGPDRLTVLREGKVLHQGSRTPGTVGRRGAERAGFFREGHVYSSQDGYTAPEEVWVIDCRHVTKTPAGERIAFGFVRIGTDRKWTPTGLGGSDWNRVQWTEEKPQA
ncbi:hypothetical protein [Streptomyces sp. NPDC048442]|uniref:hypothetical protein n=1 Tax=Streptomyces sp. NPDC048442 TaxID=3154823 RepID=UPI0034322D4E